MITIKQLPLVAIIGRRNVGKSTLFNRIIEESKALVSPIPGTTRDVIYGEPVWRGRTFAVVDTAGLDIEGKGELERNVLKQIERARKEAEIILLLLDAKTGPLGEDRKLIGELLLGKKPYLVVINKVDNLKMRAGLAGKEWQNLPIKKFIPVSAKNGSGVGDLLDEIYNLFLEQKIELPAAAKLQTVKISIIGKPNVGKSSLLNALLGKEVAVVSALPYTTREPQDITVLYKDELLTLVDTAGIRKKARIEGGFEKIGVVASIKSLKKSDIALLVLDLSEPLGVQDKRLARLVSQSKKGLIIVANKIDLVKSKEWHKIFTKHLKNYLPYLAWAPTVFVSAKSGQNVKKIYDQILAIAASRKKIISLEDLNIFIKKLIAKNKPKKEKGVRHPYIFSLRQTGVNPPAFMLAIKEKTSIHPAYLKFLEKKIRERFEFKGTPIIIETKHIRI